MANLTAGQFGRCLDNTEALPVLSYFLTDSFYISRLQNVDFSGE